MEQIDRIISEFADAVSEGHWQRAELLADHLFRFATEAERVYTRERWLEPTPA